MIQYQLTSNQAALYACEYANLSQSLIIDRTIRQCLKHAAMSDADFAFPCQVVPLLTQSPPQQLYGQITDNDWDQLLAHQCQNRSTSWASDVMESESKAYFGFERGISVSLYTMGQCSKFVP